MQDVKQRLVGTKAKLVMVAAVCCGSLAQAAIPTQYQNSNDLNAMLSYVQASPTIMADLQAIDLVSQTVFYGEGCTAVFERLVIEKPAGWVGPSDPLVIKEDSCPNYDDMAEMHDHDIGEEDSITSRETGACSVDVKEDEICKP
jgi:hypothetical protein